jgi:hypothetical protein
MLPKSLRVSHVDSGTLLELTFRLIIACADSLDNLTCNARMRSVVWYNNDSNIETK